MVLTVCGIDGGYPDNGEKEAHARNSGRDYGAVAAEVRAISDRQGRFDMA
ncbi:MAG: hypothetical protein ACREO8_11685 [Luteimonas sp.]